MNTRIHKGAALLLGLLLLAFSNVAWSLGLGDAKVQSFLDQPLEVEIELITQPTDDLSAIRVGLASAADYELIGASRNDISMPLAFSITGTPGDASVSVTSQLPVRNPVVRLIVEVNSASGRMLREYTLFLDPATFSQPAPAPQVRPAAAAPGTSVPATVATPATEPQSTPTPPRQLSGGAGEYGPVKSGDTLWRIAKDWSEGTGLGINQVMVAIQRNNPQAFSRGNINLLQRGAILRMPAAEEVSAVPVAEAIAEVRQQTEEFQMRQDVTSAATPLLVDENTAPQAVQPEPQPAPAAEPAIAAQTEPEAETVPEPAPEPELAGGAEESAAAEIEELVEDDNLALEFDSQLELVPPSAESDREGAAGLAETEQEADANGSVRELREELARKEEELINQQQQNAYLEQRLKELESQVAAADAGNIEDRSLSSMEDRLRQERLEREGTGDKPWYSGWTWLWIALLVVAAGLAGWFMNRRGGSPDSDDSSKALREIQDEAEDVLRVLDNDAAGEPEEEALGPQTADSPDAEEEAEPESEETVVIPMSKKKKKTVERRDDEAELLDEESADPEIQLDLARAYISMGDKEAARVILDEVMANGSDAQKAEATKMKNLL
jgi:pilus assembly protein FimV